MNKNSDLYCATCELQCDSLVLSLNLMFLNANVGVFKVKYNDHMRGKGHANKLKNKLFCHICQLQCDSQVNTVFVLL